MSSYLPFLHPVATKKTRASLLSSAFMALLLLVIMMMCMVLGEVTPVSMRTKPSTRSYRSDSRHTAVAFASPSKHDPRQQREGTTAKSFAAVFAARESPPSSALLLFAESSENRPSRRDFLGRSLAATSAVIVSPQLAFVNVAAFAVEANSTTVVDWDSFGAQLQKSQFPPASGGPAAFPVNGGSDLDKALQDSSKRKTIDPRTHG